MEKHEQRNSLSDGDLLIPNQCYNSVGSSNNIPNQAQYTKAEVESYNGVSSPSSENKLFVE